jgi:phasin
MMSFEKGSLVMSESGVFGYRIAFPGLFGAFAEQGAAGAQQGCEKMKGVSEGMAEALRETYSNTARSATDYGLKLIEISNANTASAFDFIAHLLGSKSAADAFTLSAAQARRGFDAASAQNKELWQLAQRFAMATGEPVRKQVAAVLRRTN